MGAVVDTIGPYLGTRALVRIEEVLRPDLLLPEKRPRHESIKSLGSSAVVCFWLNKPQKARLSFEIV